MYLTCIDTFFALTISPLSAVLSCHTIFSGYVFVTIVFSKPIKNHPTQAETHVSLRVRLGLLVNHSWGNRPVGFVHPPVAATLPHVALFKIEQSTLPNYRLRLPLSKFRYQTQPLCILPEACCNRKRLACFAVCWQSGCTQRHPSQHHSSVSLPLSFGTDTVLQSIGRARLRPASLFPIKAQER